MDRIFIALRQAFRSLFLPRILLLIVLPFILATIVWGVIAWSFWNDWVASLSSWLGLGLEPAWLRRWGLSTLAAGLIHITLGVLMVLLVLLSAVLIIATIAMPIMVQHVGVQQYPALERKNGGTFVGSAWNALTTLGLYLLLLLVSLPLLLIPFFTLLVPLILTAWLNQRIFRYDALALHASEAERKVILQSSRGKLFTLAGLLALLQFIPLLTPLTLVFAGLAFTHFCLNELVELRGKASSLRQT